MGRKRSHRHGRDTEHVAVFIWALTGSNTEKRQLRTDGGNPQLAFFFFFP